jgi:DNA-binding HxlR family transcriptional regulator
VEHAIAVLAALQQAFRRSDTPQAVRHAVTAFTHVRRIHIVQALANGPLRADTLATLCAISRPALYRHLDKLARRGVVADKPHDTWQLTHPRARLLQELLTLVTTGHVVSHFRKCETGAPTCDNPPAGTPVAP